MMKNNKEHIDPKDIIEYVAQHRNTMSEDAKQLVKDVTMLCESIGSLLEDKKELVTIFHIGFVASMSSIDCLDMVCQMGSSKGIKLAIEELNKDAKNED